MIVLALILLAGLSGCRATGRAEIPLHPFQDHLGACAAAIQRGDLDRARVDLDEAKRVAAGDAQALKVRSMERLLDGADALMAGDGATAAAQWSRIEDVALRQEVRHRARLFGVNVPTTPVPETGGEEDQS
jgi:hypothetical protein